MTKSKSKPKAAPRKRKPKTIAAAIDDAADNLRKAGAKVEFRNPADGSTTSIDFSAKKGGGRVEPDGTATRLTPEPEPESGDLPLAGGKVNMVTAESASAELRELFDRWIALRDQAGELANAINDIFNEAKARGYDSKILRKVFAARTRNPDDLAEEQTLFEIYLDAIDLSAAEREGGEGE